jgi:hypothetical protein
MKKIKEILLATVFMICGCSYGANLTWSPDSLSSAHLVRDAFSHIRGRHPRFYSEDLLKAVWEGAQYPILNECYKKSLVACGIQGIDPKDIVENNINKIASDGNITNFAKNIRKSYIEEALPIAINQFLRWGRNATIDIGAQIIDILGHLFLIGEIDQENNELQNLIGEALKKVIHTYANLDVNSHNREFLLMIREGIKNEKLLNSIHPLIKDVTVKIQEFALDKDQITKFAQFVMCDNNGDVYRTLMMYDITDQLTTIITDLARALGMDISIPETRVMTASQSNLVSPPEGNGCDECMAGLSGCGGCMAGLSKLL